MQNMRLENLLEKIKFKDKKRILQLRTELKKYNLFDFLNQISSLMLVPENQSKFQIFQVIISTSLSLNENEFNENNHISRPKLDYFIEEFSKLNIKHMIDPPEFPFILPVIYYDNYYIFMGNNTVSPLCLNNLLKIFSQHSHELSTEDFKKTNSIILGLLKLSDNIYKSLNIKIESLKSYNKDIKIKTLTADVLNDYKKLLIFTKEEMDKMFGNYYEELVIKFGNIQESEIYNIDNQKFYKKPFVSYKGSYVLLDITSFLLIIMDSILEIFILNKKNNLINAYNMKNLSEIKKCYQRMGFKQLDPRQFNINLKYTNTIHESLYLCGNDIVFYNLVLFDNGERYNDNTEYQYKIEENYINKRIDEIRKFLKEKNVKEDKIISIITPTILGKCIFFSNFSETDKNLLILAPYELKAISINESEEEMFLYKYIVGRNKLKYYRKNLFSELNFIALFSTQEYSFYFSDDVDTKDTLLAFIGEYSSDYILKSYLKDNYHITSFSENLLIEVMQKEENIYFAPSLIYQRQLNSLVEFENSNIWILSEENLNDTSFEETNSIIDLISYWLVQFSKEFHKLNGIFKIYIHFGKLSLKLFYDKSIKINDISICLLDKRIDITFEKKSFEYFKSDSIENEKNFISNIIKFIFESFQIDFYEGLIDSMFENHYKRKLNVVNPDLACLMYPFYNKCQLKVSKAITNLIMDDVGLFLKNKLNIYGKIDDIKVLDDIVSFIYKNMFNKIVKYNKLELISFLYLEFEKNLSELLMRNYNFANDLACYPNKRKEIEEKLINLNRTSVALKFVIEIVGATIFDGKEKVSIFDIEYILTEASQIVEYAFTRDVYINNMAENTLTLLKSNRLGYDKSFMLQVNKLFKNSTMGRMIDIIKDKKSFIHQFCTTQEEIGGFEEAFNEEFGFSLKDFNEVVKSILELAELKNNKLEIVYTIDREEIKSFIGNRVEKTEIEKIILYLSQTEREEYLKPPFPYRSVDVYPWRNNRELSLNRKPLIAYKNFIIYGYRTLVNSMFFLTELITNGTLQSKSMKMKKYISLINNKKGTEFNELAYNYLSTFKNCIVSKKVNKINGKKLLDENNNALGDIDILFISKKNKTIYVCEVKNFGLSKNMYELYNEYRSVFDPNNNKNFYKKHMKRLEWCKNNINSIKEHYELQESKWKVDYCFIVNEPLISNKAMKVHIKAYTLEEVDKYLK